MGVENNASISAEAIKFLEMFGNTPNGASVTVTPDGKEIFLRGGVPVESGQRLLGDFTTTSISDIGGGLPEIMEGGAPRP